MAPHNHPGPKNNQTRNGDHRVAPECAWIGCGAGAKGRFAGPQ